MLKNLSNVYASVDNLKPVAQREGQAIIDTKEFEVNVLFHCRRKCPLYAVVHQKKTIDLDGWIIAFSFSVKTQSLLYDNSLDWGSRPEDLRGPCDPGNIENTSSSHASSGGEITNHGKESSAERLQ